MTADRAALLALAARIEAAAEGSEELDLAVHAVAFGQIIGDRQTYTPWTRDLNAALALVPKGWSVHLHIIPWKQYLSADLGNGEDKVCRVQAATPALALTAAALRARAAAAVDD